MKMPVRAKQTTYRSRSVDKRVDNDQPKQKNSDSPSVRSTDLASNATHKMTQFSHSVSTSDDGIATTLSSRSLKTS